MFFTFHPGGPESEGILHSTPPDPFQKFERDDGIVSVIVDGKVLILNESLTKVVKEEVGSISKEEESRMRVIIPMHGEYPLKVHRLLRSDEVESEPPTTPSTEVQRDVNKET